MAQASVKIRWTENAAADLKSVHDYLSRTSADSADEIVDRILSAIDILEQYPNLGRQGRIEKTREFVVTGTRFIVFYRLRDQHVEILGILHGARKLPGNF